MDWLDWSWWPYLVVPFPFTEDGVTLDFTPVGDFLSMVFSVVGPLVVFVSVFLIVRRILVSFSGGD